MKEFVGEQNEQVSVFLSFLCLSNVNWIDSFLCLKLFCVCMKIRCKAFEKVRKNILFSFFLSFPIQKCEKKNSSMDLSCFLPAKNISQYAAKVKGKEIKW